MKKVAIVFVLAVFVPSLVLAWLAVRSLRDQQFLLERQQSLLYQGVADATAKQIQDTLADYQHAFAGKVADLLRDREPREVARSFDDVLPKDWPLAQVGFAVTPAGDILSPSPKGRPEARRFYAENDRFLANREAVEVYRNPNQKGAYNSGNTVNLNGGIVNWVNAQVAEPQSLANTTPQSGKVPLDQQSSAAPNAAAQQAAQQKIQVPNFITLTNLSQVLPATQNDLDTGRNTSPGVTLPQNSLGFGWNGNVAVTNALQQGFIVTNDANGAYGQRYSMNSSRQSVRSVTPQYQQARAINNLRNGDNLKNIDIAQQQPVRGNSSGVAQTQVSGQNVYNADNSQPVNWKAAPASANVPAQAVSRAQAEPESGVNYMANGGNDARVYVNTVPQSAGRDRAGQQGQNFQVESSQDDNQQFSKVSASEAEFRQTIGDDSEGTLARFVDNKLNVLLWCRAPRDPELIFGAALALPRLLEGLKPLVEQAEPALQDEICVALLDDMAKPVALSLPGFKAAWKRPFVATEIGESLPHWEVGVYLRDPAKLTKSAQTLKLTLGLLISVLLLAIGTGSWLIVADLNRQLTLARQKTDFVSNVSHELKTPLTSIRMFSELLAEGRVSDPARQRSYFNIITAETARLTRLINNVLDFARIERGEKKYHFQSCDVVEVVRDTAESYRPHLETNGFRLECVLPESPVFVNGDRDALAQVVVNLVSNAEKYSDGCKEITVRVAPRASPLPHVEVAVLDRGLGVPAGCGEKIFEKFYRAHDSLSSGIQGSGLGLTLARQIARAHGGEVAYEAREGGGSCFVLRLPIAPTDQVRSPKSEVRKKSE